METTTEKPKPAKTNEEIINAEADRIKWENIIFVPFHPICKLLVLFAVIIKCYNGPLNSIRSELVCQQNNNFFLELIRLGYIFCADAIYFVDIILHIAHRQVRDTAVRREYLPKNAGLLCLDLIAVTPFLDFRVGNVCSEPVRVWPHILAFTEFVVIYRVVQYFSLVKSHKQFQNLVGLAIITFLCLNCLKCWWYLVTTGGRCIECNYNNINESSNIKRDWRYAFLNKNTQTDFQHQAFHYIATTFFGTSSGAIALLSYTRLTATSGQSSILILSFAVKILLLTPKVFAEAILSYRHNYNFQARVARILTVVKRRSKNIKVYKDIQKFYQIMWIKRSGTLSVPKLIYELPKYMLIEIKEDLFWPVFYHSPTFRRTTVPFRRWLSGSVRFEFKMPGDKLHSGPQCHGNLYYIKTGIVQIVSSDDNVTPIITVTGGTVFGDINFILPALSHKVRLARCVTYCEIHYITREDILRALHLFPEDRRMIMQRAKERIKHARQLCNLKDAIEDLDRSEYEGIAWLKRRWWQLRLLHTEPSTGSVTSMQEVEIPPEENNYHCSKYIGQLVLFSEAHLHNRSIFFTTDFPWILAPDSMFLLIWHIIVKTNVILVLILYPPILRNLNPKLGMSFMVFQFWTDFIYIIDAFISFFIYTKKDENPTSLATMALDRLKTKKFLLDILSTCLLQKLVDFSGRAKYTQLFQFTRLFKLYIFFEKTHFDKKDFKTDPLVRISVKCLILIFAYVYIGAFFILLLTQYFESLRAEFFFCNYHNNYFKSDEETPSFFRVLKVWIVSIPFSMCVGETTEEIYAMILVICIGFMVVLYVNGNMMAALYLRHREIVDFQYSTSNLMKEFIHYNIHPKLMKRLHKYILCHWKTASHVHNLKEEPYSVYHTLHDQIAEKIIQNSRAFAGADRSLVKELAHSAKFMIIPQNCTLFLLGMQCDIVSWGVNGTINYEYTDLDGNEITREYPLMELISTGSVFFENIAVRTFTAVTDCEIIYLSASHFWDILRRYPQELEHIHVCQREIMPVHEMLLSKYIYRNLHYRRKLLLQRTKSFETLDALPEPKPREKFNMQYIKKLWEQCYIKPNSKFTKRWMGFRAIIIIFSILSWSNQGGIGAGYRGQLYYVCHVCDVITIIDIILKLFMGYFNEVGIIIHDKKMCMRNYLTRNFIVDLIGVLPWYKLVGERFTGSQNLLVMTLSRTWHLYIFNGYFNFVGYRPDGSYVTMMLVKLQIIGFLMIVLCTQVEMVRCVDITWTWNHILQNMTLKDSLCWPGKTAGQELTMKEFKIFFAHSIIESQGAFLRTVGGVQKMIHLNPLLFIVSSIANLVYWLIFISCASLLISKFQGKTMYEDGIKQLKSFLEEERVEKQLIKRSINYFSYLCYRTHGVALEEQSMKDKYGFILKQDISYYFYRNTFAELSKLISLSANTRKILAVASEELYFEAGEDIMREMDVVPNVYIVHRGIIIISKNNKVLAHLPKGSIFGQLWGTSLRPIKITARTNLYADVLAIPIKRFQEVINDTTKMNIVYYDEAEDDYIPNGEKTKENPYNTIEYLNKGTKCMKLPWMTHTISARRTQWYANWLVVSWLLEPAFSAAFSFFFILEMNYNTKLRFFIVLVLLDVIHVVYMLSDFLYALNLIVEDDKCKLVARKSQRHELWSFIADILTIIPPYLSMFTGIYMFQLARLVRVRYMTYYNNYFCSSTKFQNAVRSIMFRLTVILLSGHALCCLYVKGVCEGKRTKVNVFDDLSVYPRTGEEVENCIFRKHKNKAERLWYHYYVFAMGSLITRYMGQHFAGSHVVDYESFNSVVFEMFINYGLYVIDLIITSKVVCQIFVKLRKLYTYDYHVRELLHYLNDAGVSPALLKLVSKYTTQLWNRQKGTWIPELAHSAPQCLREDIMCSLYLHHLHGPALFRDVPHYFLRQLAAKFRRIVIFPDKHIVKTGDILPYVFFINEGEVEKYYLDANTGERRLMSLLTTNGHFGVFPGIFPNTPFQCGYYTRTVVDLVYLRSEDWQTLLESYPKVKKMMNESAKQLGLELGVHDAFFK